MKTKCLIPKRYLVAALLMLIAVVLTCYDAGANLRRGSEPDPGGGADILRTENDDDPEYREKRREFFKRFFGTGPGGISAEDYKRAVAEARALPLSPLIEGHTFRSPEAPGTVAPWISPIAPPIRNSYSANASAAVNSLAIDPINANIVYTGSFGGLAKTTDGGNTWRYLSDSWDSQSVSAIAINPSDSRDIYVGTGRDDYGPYGVGIYHSLDGGSTWSSPLGETHFGGTQIRAVAIDPNASSSPFATAVYVGNGGTNSGLWRSNDSGVTWSRLYQHDVLDLAVDIGTHPSTLYVTEDHGVFKSTDAGESWTLIREIRAHRNNRLYRLSVVNSTVYLLGPGDPDPDHNLYLYKSVTGGATWVQVPTHCFDGADSCANTNNIGFGVFAVNRVNPQNIMAGNQALYRTDNEGLTWTEIGHNWGDPNPTRCIHPDQRVIAFSQSTAGVVYVGNDAGVVKSTNSGQDWANLNQNFPGALLYGVALSRDGTMIAGTQDNGVVFSDPLMPWGRTWEAIYGGDSAHNLIDPMDSRVAYFTMYGKGVWKRVTRPGPGATPGPGYDIRPPQFTGVDGDSACSFFPTFNMNPLAPKHLLAACQRVVRTLDGTASPVVWTTIGNGPLPSGTPGVVAVVTAATEAPSNPNVIYAVTNGDTVFVTSNAGLGNGATWQQVTRFREPGGIRAVTVDPINYQTAYLACDSGIYKTTDMGTTWTGYGIERLIYRDVAIDPAYPQHIFAASNAGVLASIDGGLHWGNMSEGIPAGMVITALSFNATSRQLAASTFGRGVYLLHIGRPEQPPRSSPTPRPRR